MSPNCHNELNEEVCVNINEVLSLPSSIFGPAFSDRVLEVQLEGGQEREIGQEDNVIGRGEIK